MSRIGCEPTPVLPPGPSLTEGGCKAEGRTGGFSRTGGFTLVELLVATLLVGISVAGVFGGLRVMAQTEARARDVALLQRLAEQRIAALESVEDVTTADDRGDFTDEGYPDVTYTLAVEQESDEVNLQRVTVTVERGALRQSLTQLIFVRPEASTTAGATP